MAEQRTLKALVNRETGEVKMAQLQVNDVVTRPPWVWLPLADDMPAHDPETQTIENVRYELRGDIVVQIADVRNKPPQTIPRGLINEPDLCNALFSMMNVIRENNGDPRLDREEFNRWLRGAAT